MTEQQRDRPSFDVEYLAALDRRIKASDEKPEIAYVYLGYYGEYRCAMKPMNISTTLEIAKARMESIAMKRTNWYSDDTFWNDKITWDEWPQVEQEYTDKWGGKRKDRMSIRRVSLDVDTSAWI